MYAHDNVKYATLYKHHRNEGGKATREYRAFRDMMNRCYYTKHNRYHRYGGRGITVCPRWLEPRGFDHFVDDLGRCPDGFQLERVDNDGPYSPENCIWETRENQCLNRSTTRKIEHQGKTLSINEWADSTGIPYNTLEARLNRSNMTVQEALETPVRHTNYRGALVINYKGQDKGLAEWCRYLNLPYPTIQARLAKGWSVDEAFETPIRIMRKTA